MNDMNEWIRSRAGRTPAGTMQEFVAPPDGQYTPDNSAAFAQAAQAAGVRNVKAAAVVARELGYIAPDGTPRMAAFRKDYPEFFGPPSNANAGAGTSSPPAEQRSMNSIIRQAVNGGRRVD